MRMTTRDVSSVAWLVVCCILLCDSAAVAKVSFVQSAVDQTAQLAVTNHENDSEVRYSVVLLRGTLGADDKSLAIRNLNAAENAASVKPVLHQGQFKALVELVEGENTIELSTDQTNAQERPALQLKLTYKPQTNPYYIRLIWMTDSTGDTAFAAPTDDTPQDYEARLRTAALLMQTFTAEKMNELGLGRRTFRLERDEKGQVVVHTLKGPETRQRYYEIAEKSDVIWWRHIQRWLDEEHRDPMAKNVVIAAYTRKDPQTGGMLGHTALGGGNLGLFGSGSVFSWPRDLQSAADVFLDDTKVDGSKVHDDSANRGTHWALASTTIGATLHEMGHTFGLPHTRDGRDIMTRGFDKFNRLFTFYDPPANHSRRREFAQDQEAYFAPVSASFLRWSRWFQLDQQVDVGDAHPAVTIDKVNKVVTIASDAGVPWVGFWVGGEIVAYREFQEQPLPEKVEFTFDEIKTMLNGEQLSKMSVIAGNGQHVERPFR